jgi:hypothetical protein
MTQRLPLCDQAAGVPDGLAVAPASCPGPQPDEQARARLLRAAGRADDAAPAEGGTMTRDGRSRALLPLPRASLDVTGRDLRSAVNLSPPARGSPPPGASRRRRH